jgi:hypothetical protein
LSEHLFELFDQVRIINLVDRPDRRREMESQLVRAGAIGSNVRFFEALRPVTAGEFPSVGARGCFESQLAVLREARDAGARSLLLLEDDFDFTRDGRTRAAEMFSKLFKSDWDFFYGAHVLPSELRAGLVSVSPTEPVLTASFVAFRGRVLPVLIHFLESVSKRKAGSPDFGPMHVDGAYTVFRQLHPEYQTFAAFPPFGRQRSSRSDITPTRMVLDRWVATEKIGRVLRAGYNWLRR